MADNSSDAATELHAATLRAALEVKPDLAQADPAPALDPDPEALAAAARAARNAEGERLREVARNMGPVKYRGRPMSEVGKLGIVGWVRGK